MAAKKKTPAAASKSELDHPHQAGIELLRGLIRSADPRVTELVKWNAPSYAIAGQDFATFHLRAKQGIQLILHFGAKKRGDLPAREAIADPGQLLTWLGPDRATLRWADVDEVRATRPAVLALLRSWIAVLPLS